jgi:hypothetical protein
LLLIESHFQPATAPAWRDLGLTPVLSCKRKWLSEINPAAVLAHAGPVILDDESLSPAEVPSQWSAARVKELLAASAHVRKAARRRPKSRRGIGLGWFPGLVMGQNFNPLNWASGEPIRRAMAALAWGGFFDAFDFLACDTYCRHSGGNTEAELIARFDADFAHTLHAAKDIAGKPIAPYVSPYFHGDGSPLPLPVWAHVVRAMRAAAERKEIQGITVFAGWSPQTGPQPWTQFDDEWAGILAA